MDVAIVADDLTGAADSAVEFTGLERQVQVVLGEPFGHHAGVVAVDIDSREMPAAEAGRRVTAAVTALAPPSPALWFKKLDSTLRGNVATELMSFAAAVGCSLLLVTPAFPAQGRGIVNGTLWSEEQHRDGHQVLPHLPTLIGLEGPTPLALPLALVHKGPAVIEARLRDAPLGSLVVADAVADADLDCLVVAAQRTGGRVAYAGSAGLAAALGRAQGAAVRAAPMVSAPARVLLIVGSRQPASRRQLALAAGHLGPPFVVPMPETTRQAKAFHRAEIERTFRQHGALILVTPTTPVNDSRAVAAGVAATAVALIAQYDLQRIFCTGGEVARAVCDRLGIRRLAVEGRVQEGIPALRALDGAPGLVMVTKAGGFGGDDCLLRAHHYLAGIKAG